MASVQKFSKRAVMNQIRHIERTANNNSNTDIDTEKFSLNYSLINRDVNAFDYYRERLDRCYVYGRDDVKTMFGWIVTCPEDVPAELQDLFFYNVHDFLCERYGEENCVQAVVHKDESGSPHLHWLGMPVVEDKKHEQGLKVCCNNVINRQDLRTFHEDLDKFLKNRGMKCGVYTGITKAQGGNRTVKEMKKERAIENTREIKQNRWDRTDRTSDRERTISRW